MSKEKTVEEAIGFLSDHITSPMAKLIADMVVQALKETLGQEVLNKKVEAPE